MATPPWWCVRDVPEGLMRSEVHLPLPGLISREFTTDEQMQLREELERIDNKQLALKIREERKTKY
jgi:hypothetical protein